MEWRIEIYVAELDSSFSEPLCVASHKTYAVSQSVAGGIFIRDVYQLGINFDPLHAQASYPRGKAKTRNTRARSQFEHRCARFGRYRGSEQHSVVSGAKTLLWLSNDNGSAKKAVDRIGFERHAHIGSGGSASASSVLARIRSPSATMSRRGRTPRLPSITLIWLSNTRLWIPASCSTACAKER